MLINPTFVIEKINIRNQMVVDNVNSLLQHTPNIENKPFIPL